MSNRPTSDDQRLSGKEGGPTPLAIFALLTLLGGFAFAGILGDPRFAFLGFPGFVVLSMRFGGGYRQWRRHCVDEVWYAGDFLRVRHAHMPPPAPAPIPAKT